MVKLLADVKASPKLAKVINVFTTEKFAQALTQRRKDAEALGKAFDPRQARGYDAQWIADGQEKIMRVLNSPHVVAYGFKAPQTAKFCKPAASENRFFTTPKLAMSGGQPLELRFSVIRSGDLRGVQAGFCARYSRTSVLRRSSSGATVVKAAFT